MTHRITSQAARRSRTRCQAAIMLSYTSKFFEAEYAVQEHPLQKLLSAIENQATGVQVGCAGQCSVQQRAQQVTLGVFRLAHTKRVSAATDVHSLVPGPVCCASSNSSPG